MIKVCHFTSAHNTNNVRIFHKECVSLAAAGYDVTLVGKGGSAERDGVHIIGVERNSHNRFERMLLFARKVYKAALAVDADVYHFHDPELLPFGLKLKQKGKVVVFDSHENSAQTILEKYYIPGFLRKLVYRLYTGLEKKVCRRLDAIVIVTPNMREYFEKINGHVYQITNYPILQPIERVPDYSSKKIGFAGGISESWNHHNVLKALEKLPGWRYVLCGDTGGGAMGYMSALQKLPGWRQVDYLGRLPHKRAIEELSKCSVGLALCSVCRNTGWREGTLGNTKIFEEMMVGLPIVCTDFVLWREFVDRWHCGICIDPQSSDEIAKAIQYIADHPNEARQMGENGRRAIEQEFNWEREKKNLLSMYKDLLEP